MVDVNITPIGSLNGPTQIKTAKPVETESQPSFGQWLRDCLSEVNNMKLEADEAARKLISGESRDIHGTMIAMQKANIAMDLVLEVRNKVVAAYDEIKRMQF